MIQKSRGQAPRKVTIRDREEDVYEHVDALRDAFAFTGPVFVAADVEGQPDPYRDWWVLRAQVQEDAAIVVKLGGPAHNAILVMISRSKFPFSNKQDGVVTGISEMREAIPRGDPMSFDIWLSRAWSFLNPEKVCRLKEPL